MYICIAHSCDTIDFKERETIYRIYDTGIETYRDMDYITIYNMLANEVAIGNLTLRGKRITGDNIDIIKLKAPWNHDRAIIIGYIRDKSGNTIGYDIVWQTGNKGYCTYDQAVEMVTRKWIINATIVNGRVRLLSTKVMGNRTVDTDKFNKQAKKSYDKRRKALMEREEKLKDNASKGIRSDIYKTTQSSEITSTDDRRCREQKRLVSSMLKEYATPKIFQSERAIMKMFKR